MPNMDHAAGLTFAITLGDPAGIGPEIIAKAFRDAPEATRGCFVAGDVGVMTRALGFLGDEAADLGVALLEQGKHGGGDRVLGHSGPSYPPRGATRGTR